MKILLTHKARAPRLTQSSVQKVLRAVGKEVQLPKDFSVSIVTVGDAEMQKLNKQYRNIDAVTDVLSFPYDDDILTGEIVLCYPQALRQAKYKQAPIDRELAWLTTHGILHVLGYDHEIAADAKIMRPLERLILQHV